MMRAMSPSTIEITTDDGKCPAHVFQPEGNGPWPGVLFFMDGIGIRPALFEMGDKMASAGYHVLLPDLFYRGGPYEPVDAKKVFVDPDMRAALMKKLTGLVSIELIMRDTRAFLAHLDSQPQVKPGKVGVTGYCMGGGIAIRAAGTFPDRIAVAASFHGGNLATDAEDSPHLLAPKMKAKILVAGADEDRGFDEAQCERVDTALKDAGLDADVSIWKGARHGWVPTDMPVYNEDAAERHWRELVALFDSVLK
jgi:carboxymethylenebutenolidase